VTRAPEEPAATALAGGAGGPKGGSRRRAAASAGHASAGGGAAAGGPAPPRRDSTQAQDRGRPWPDGFVPQVDRPAAPPPRRLAASPPRRPAARCLAASPPRRPAAPPRGPSGLSAANSPAHPSPRLCFVRRCLRTGCRPARACSHR